ncbi:MAG: T9SS type A sorting domain-containing protein [Flavobacteriales bacterium]|nr:T9SS type A sorting domain-containing protein [Flavobacteriales bacterium]
MTRSFLLVILMAVIGSSQIKAQADCDLSYLTTIENFTVFTHNPSGAILYRAKMAIDADGCPRAYGPNNSGLDWTANAGYPGNWWGIVTDSNGDPVIQGASDPYPGMYVSSTSLVRSGYANSNPLRYVDSENIPYIALPSALQSLAGIQKGDLAYVRNVNTGLGCYAYFADTGPGGKLGEGSMYLAAQLGLNSSPKTGGTSQPIIDYIVFPGSGMGQGTHLSVAQINSMGQAELNAAGGVTLADCIDTYNPLDCSNTIPLSCGVSYHGAASSATSLVGTYGCNTWTESGPERIHSIVPSGNGTITASLSNFTGDLDVYILGSCDPNDCLGTVGSSSATYTGAIAGQTYYIVVDADDGSGSAYDLVVSCPASTSTDNIGLSGAGVSSSNVMAGSSFTASVTQTYSGSQLAANLADPSVGYYLSVDCNLSTDDLLLGSDVSDLGSNAASSLESSVITIPSSTTAGSYYILFIADVNNDVSESNEGDNTICVAITIDPLVLNCSSAVALTCGVSYHGVSSTAPSYVDTYGCNGWTESGPERIHTITPSTSGTLAVTISNFTGDLDVYILVSCDPGDCVGTVASSSATYSSAIAGHTYYIVVDADDGSGSAYDLVVNCPTVSDDLWMQNLSLSDVMVDTSEQININLDLNYTGTQLAVNVPDVELAFYLSTDCIWDAGDQLLTTSLENVGSDQSTVNVGVNTVIPNGILAGNYYVLCLADNMNMLTEADENNNSICTPITVCRNANGIDTRSACDTYTWINGVTYSSTTNVPTYVIAGGTAFGCDSTAQLDLTIKLSTSSAFFEMGCVSYLSPSGKYTWTQSGMYKDTILNAAGCDSVMNINLTIVDPDEQVVQTGNVLQAAVNDSYSWIDCSDMTVINGANAQQFVANQDGSYAVIVNANGCADTSLCYQVVGTGISEAAMISDQVSIYPNPFRTELNMEFSQVYERVVVAIEDINGKQIGSYTYGYAERLVLPMDVDAGIYLIKVSLDHGDPITVKVVKEE